MNKILMKKLVAIPVVLVCAFSEQFALDIAKNTDWDWPTRSYFRWNERCNRVITWARGTTQHAGSLFE